MKQYVVIGNGVAAVGCVEGIRSVDKDSKITVVSEEKYPVMWWRDPEAKSPII